jgi:hypothetical protein
VDQLVDAQLQVHDLGAQAAGSKGSANKDQH